MSGLKQAKVEVACSHHVNHNHCECDNHGHHHNHDHHTNHQENTTESCGCSDAQCHESSQSSEMDDGEDEDSHRRPLQSLEVCSDGSCGVSESLASQSQVVDILSDIGCGCGCEEPAPPNKGKKAKSKAHTHLHDHDHDHDHDVTDIFSDDLHDHDHSHEELSSSSKLVTFIQARAQLIIAFVLFFTAIFTGFSEQVDLALYVAAYVLVGRRVVFSAIKNVLKGKMLDENFLMAIASIVAFAIGEATEGVAVMLFYAVGQLTEDYAISSTKRSISKLLDLRPDYANIKTPKGTIKVAPAKVNIGEVLIVKPGERIPLDGLVVAGESELDTAMLTGESLPVSVKPGSQVYSGTINTHTVIEVQVTQSFANSAVSKILAMVQKANENKAETEKFITKFAKVYTPLVVLGAALLAVIPPLFFGQSFDTWIYRGAIFLVVSCPCALVISVPLGYFGGLGGAARKGVLVKGGQYLEVLKQTKTIVFDKTGTLTKGNFTVTNIETFEGYAEAEVLKISAHVEHYSNHPIAHAIVRAYGQDLNGQVDQVQEVAGKGIKANYEGSSILLGNDALLSDHGITYPPNHTVGTSLYLVVNQVLVGILHINDQLKTQTKSGLQALKALGVNRFVMLTGDRKPIAEAIAKDLGITEVHAELLPGDKLSVLEDILKTEAHVAFIGDGINDAPVLSRADVGIAMGSLGSDVAIESSDVVLMTDEITAVADGIKVARFTSKIIWQNIVLALGIKIVIMILGSIGFASLWMAIFGDVGVAFLAILNSGRAIYNK